MNIVVFSHDLPWPVNHGGRMDMFNRLKAFKELGHNILFVGWTLGDDDNQSQENLRQMHKVVDQVISFSRKKGGFDRLLNILTKLAKLSYQPNLVTQCSLKEKVFRQVQKSIENFNPDMIFVENIYVAQLAYKFSKALNLSVFIRSHNIEHIYIKKMVGLSRSLKVRFKFLAMSINLERYERRMLQKADAVFDISLSDLEFWKSQGLEKNYWMPPIYYDKSRNADTIVNNGINYDIAYIGNLNSPNNIHGLFWFLEEILPIVNKSYQNVRILIAGSRPSQILSDYCLLKSNIILLPDPDDVMSLYAQSKVLINPICFGSGVNIKTIEMLHIFKPLVCTSKAIEGLPKEIDQLFDIANEAYDFASKILKHLLHAQYQPLPRTAMMEYFKSSHLTTSIAVMGKLRQIKGSNNKGKFKN